MMKVAVALAAAVLAAPSAAAADPASLVDTRDGSLGAGFPMVGASAPFGMIQPGPDTALANGQQDPVDYCGYSWQDPDIRGFSLTHFDGAGIMIAGDLPFMPTTGAVSSSDPAAFASPFSHASEVAEPGYYAVTLARYGIRAELTGTTRAALMRFTFPRTTQANVLAEVTQSIDGSNKGSVSVVGDDELQGWTKSDVGYTVYFDAVFDRPFRSSGPDSATFDTTVQPTVTMRVGISYVDQAGAAGNLATELPKRETFDQVRRAARAEWDRRLSDVRISGGASSEQRTFYDNLYRALLMPSVLDDSDGRYPGMDGAIHQVEPGHHHYTALSLWDTYRSQTPLLELLEPSIAHDVLVSLLDDADQNHDGVIPRWVQANLDRGIMGGDSGSATLADGAAEGLLAPADAQRALADLLHQATALPPVWPREHLDAYLKYGYVPYDVDGIGTSLTEEYDIDDNAVAQLAHALGDTADASALRTRAGYWRNLVDPANHFIQPRNSDGTWANPPHSTDPGISTVNLPVQPPYNPAFQDGYQEGTGWQYLWAVPHDVAGLAGAIGGAPVALRRLDRYFSTALNQPLAPVVPVAQQYSSFFGVYYFGDQYTPANEPDLWAPWYYDWFGQPWKTQKVARAEMSVYNPRPDGLPGNDDTGEMSAWYVLAALGIYHAAPGVVAWELSSPLFPQAVLRATHLTIDAPAAGNARPYVHGVRLNGSAIERTYLTSCELRTGGTLSFSLGALPDRSWGSAASDAPPSATAPSSSVDSCAASLA